MEDLKKIQEFFSKPLEENVDKKYSNFLVALRDSGVTNMFGAAPYLQAEFGLDKREAREVLANWMRSFGESLNENAFVEAFKFEKALKGMGYDVKVKYLDDFGKDVFEIYFNNPADADDSIFYDAKKLGYDNVRVFANPQESLNENEDPIIVKYFKRGDNHFQILVKYERPTGFTTALGSRTATGQGIDQNEATAQERVEAIVNKLKADYNLDNIEVSKGQVAGRYYIDAFSDSFRGMDINDLEEFYGLNEATKDEETEFHTKLDKLVHDTFGKRKGEMEEYNSGIYYDPAKERNAVKAKEASKSALERVKDMIKKIASEQKMGEALSDHEEEEANYDELYGDYKYKVDEAKPKKGHGDKISKEVFSKLKGKTINYKGADYKVLDSDEAVLKIKHLEDGDVTTINLRQFNLKGMIDEMIETIKLGKNLNEELCPKGKAYIKKRHGSR